LYLLSFEGYLILGGGRGKDGTNGVEETVEKLGTEDFRMNLALMALWSEPGTQVRSVGISESRR
jgi:hypothetical protein